MPLIAAAVVLVGIACVSTSYADVLDAVRFGDRSGDRQTIRNHSGARIGTTESAPSGRTIIRGRSGSRIGTAERYGSGRTIIRDRTGKRIGTLAPSRR